MQILRKRGHYYALYTALFAVLSFLGIALSFLVSGKSILRVWDTFDMHYIAFVSHGEWLRGLFGQGTFGMWNPNIGYGADYLLSLAFIIADPFSFLAVFFKPENSEFIFTLCTYLKLYLCGLSFSVFAFRRGQPPWAVLCGSLIYTFSACAYTGMYQSVFILPTILFPLLLTGADELFEENRPLSYVLVLACCAAINFYNTYMMILMLVGYCVLKWFFAPGQPKTWRSFFGMVGRFLLCSLLAAGIAAVVLLPLAMLMLGMDRLGLERSVGLFYDGSYYANMFKGFISSFNMLSRDCEIGFSVLAVPGVCSLFLGRKRHTGLKIAFVLMSIALCLPAAGVVMNGFGYAANRWIWGYALVVSYICTLTFSQWHEWSGQKKIPLLVGSAVYLLLAYLVFGAGGIGFALLSVALVIVTLAAYRADCFEPRYFQRAMIVLSCLTVLLSAWVEYTPELTPPTASYVPAGAAYERITQYGGSPLIEHVDTSDGTRYNRHDLTVYRNTSLVNGASGIDFYFNLYNDRIDRFHNSIALNTSPWPFGYQGLDRRSELLALMGVDHFFVRKSNPYYPVGFTRLEAETNALGRVPIQSWTTEKGYGLFTRYDQAVSYEDYESLTPFTRQQLLMQACVVDGEHADTYVEQIPLDSGRVPFTVDRENTTVEWDGNLLNVPTDQATLSLRFDPLSNGELYIYFGNIVYDHPSATAYQINVQGFSGDTLPGHMTNTLSGDTSNSHMYGGKHNWLLNIGKSEAAVDRVLLTFSKAGKYSVDSIQLLFRPENDIIVKIGSLNQDVGNLRFLPNEVRLDVTNETPEYLMAAIPYSTGWRAYDNGQEAEILPAAHAFMALRLQPGEHSLRFTYCTPGLLPGALISLVSIAAFAMVVRRKNRTKQPALHANQQTEEMDGVIK